MARKLNTKNLDQAAVDYAGMFLQQSTKTPSGKRWANGPEKVMQDFHAFHFKDVFEYMLAKIREELGKNARDRFDALAKKHFTAREDKVFEKYLRDRLAVDLNGDHIEGAIGKVEIGRRLLHRVPAIRRAPRVRPVRRGHPEGDWEIFDYRERVVSRRREWPVYAGEPEERIAESNAPDPLPDDALPSDPYGNAPKPVGANVTNISALLCTTMLDEVETRLIEGTTAATIRGRTGSQPADPDASETGTLLFTLTCSDPDAIAAASDDGDGSCSATFQSITDDTSADASGTLTYCRIGSTGTASDDHIDGNATTDGTGATDWNTTSIVAGSTVSMTSAVVGQSQGSTAT